MLVCPRNAISERNREVGIVKRGRATVPVAEGVSDANIEIVFGELRLGEPSPVAVVRAVKDALNAQNFEHSPQKSHFDSLTAGTFTKTFRSSSTEGFRKMCAFGSSTSQSKKRTGFPASVSEIARFTATVVLPVPPFPLATERIMLHADVNALHRHQQAVCSLAHAAHAALPSHSSAAPSGMPSSSSVPGVPASVLVGCFTEPARGEVAQCVPCLLYTSPSPRDS